MLLSSAQGAKSCHPDLLLWGLPGRRVLLVLVSIFAQKCCSRQHREQNRVIQISSYGGCRGGVYFWFSSQSSLKNVALVSTGSKIVSSRSPPIGAAGEACTFGSRLNLRSKTLLSSAQGAKSCHPDLLL